MIAYIDEHRGQFGVGPACKVLTDAGVAIAPGTNVGLDELSSQILNAVADKYEFRVADGYARFTCVRRVPTV